MTDLNQIKDQLNIEDNDMKTLPQGLNVLTILTYVGSALQLLGAIYTYFTIEASYKMVQNMDTQNNSDVPAGLGKIMSGATEMIKKQYENRTLILLVAVLAAIGCFYGAMQMRNRKKMGYNVYVISELLYPVVNLILVGMAGGILGIFGFIVPIIFIILYTVQRKYLIY